MYNVTGLLIFCGKKSKISRDFQGQIRGKIGRFRGKKVKIRGKISRFLVFLQEKVKIRGKIGRFRGIFAKKVKFRRIFRGKFLEKSADFTGNFGGKPCHETISKKQPILLDFGGEI